MVAWKTDNYSKTVESWCEKNFAESKNDDGNRNKKRRRPLSEHDGEQPRWYIIFQRTRVKWKMNPYKREVLRGDGAGKLRIVLPKTRESAVVPWVRPSTAPPPSLSLIITHSLCTRENYSLYPSSTSTCLLLHVPPRLISTLFLNSSLLYPSPCHALLAKYFVFIRYCVFAKLYGRFMHYCVPQNNNL